jgi:hypothetical protein
MKLVDIEYRGELLDDNLCGFVGSSAGQFL